MRPLPPGTDLSFLRDVQLLQVCVGRNEVILNFDQDVRLTVLSDFAVSPPNGAQVTYDDPTVGAVALFALLHDSIDTAGATADGNLSLTFRSGACVEVLNTSTEYESFWIQRGTERIIA